MNCPLSVVQYIGRVLRGNRGGISYSGNIVRIFCLKPVSRFRFLCRVAQEDDIQGNQILIQPQDLRYPCFGFRLGMNSAPDSAESKVNRPQENVFRGGTAVLDPVGRKVSRQRSWKISGHTIARGAVIRVKRDALRRAVRMSGFVIT